MFCLCSDSCSTVKVTTAWWSFYFPLPTTIQSELKKNLELWECAMTQSLSSKIQSLSWYTLEFSLLGVIQPLDWLGHLNCSFCYRYWCVLQPGFRWDQREGHLPNGVWCSKQKVEGAGFQWPILGATRDRSPGKRRGKVRSFLLAAPLNKSRFLGVCQWPDTSSEISHLDFLCYRHLLCSPNHPSSVPADCLLVG